MLERTLIVLVLVVMAWAVLRWNQRRIFKRRVQDGLQLDAYVPGSPAVLYFTLPGCLPCQTIQKPALTELEDWIGPGLQILTVDASLDLDLARAWGVLSVPTTFLIDSLGRPRRVNHGAVSAPVLLEQFRSIGEPLEVLAGRAPADNRLFKVESRNAREQIG